LKLYSPQLAKADFASSLQHVGEGQRIAEVEAKIDALQRQALVIVLSPSDPRSKSPYRHDAMW